MSKTQNRLPATGPNTAFRPLKTLFLCGPTASGKSSAALHIASACGGEIVNADAFQLYRGLETLTAAPSREDRGLVPHHLYSVIDPEENLDAAAYRRLAEPILETLNDRTRPAIVVGGSGLYLKFLTHGPSELPPGNPKLRAELDALALDELSQRLQDLDPAEAARVDLKNRRYVQRALEICLLTGRPVSEQRHSFDADPAHLRGLFLTWDPPALEERIRRRTNAMLSGGAIDEVAARPNLGTTASRAIGVREIRALLAGEIDRPTCEERIVIATRRYAKRQRTWFRREQWLTPVPGNATTEKLVAAARHLLDHDRPN